MHEQVSPAAIQRLNAIDDAAEYLVPTARKWLGGQTSAAELGNALTKFILAYDGIKSAEGKK